jgi:hypothetical protein
MVSNDSFERFEFFKVVLRFWLKIFLIKLLIIKNLANLKPRAWNDLDCEIIFSKTVLGLESVEKVKNTEGGIFEF